MKKLYSTLTATLFAASAFAQLQTGTKFIGTHLGASIIKSNAYSKTTSYHIMPTAGYFLNSKWAIGAHGLYERSIYEENNLSAPVSSGGYTSYYSMHGKIKVNSYSFGPVTRYYQPLGNKFSFFAETIAGFLSTKQNIESKVVQQQFEPSTGSGQSFRSFYGTPTSVSYSSQQNKLKEEYLYGSIAPGVVFFPVPKVGLELKASLLSYTYNRDKGSEAELAFNLSKATIGAGFYFN